MKLGLLVNPTAGRGEATQLMSAFRHHLSGHDIVDLSRPSYEQAATTARAALVAGLDALIVVGGDGMVHLGANVVAGTSVPLGIVAVGTGNDVAGALRLPIHDVAAALQVITTALAHRQYRSIDLVALSRPGQPPHHWYVSSLCTAIEAAVAERATRLSWPRHGGRYLRAALREVLQFRPYGLRIIADGETWDGPVTLAVVASTAIFGGGMHIAPAARPDSGTLELVLAAPLSRWKLLRLLPRLYHGGHIGHPAVTVRRVRSVRIEHSPTHGRPPPPALADGEIVGQLPLQCDVHPGALRILQTETAPTHV